MKDDRLASEFGEERRGRVSLIGFRGTGKSAVGRRLAQRLGWPWYDTDREVTRRAGRTIAELFAEQGEEAFRDWESRVLDALAGAVPSVVSLGGGAILRPSNRAIVMGWGPVVWLRADAATIAARLASDPLTRQTRPRLSELDPREEIERLLAEREPLYRQCATWTLDTAQLDVERVVERVLELMGSVDGADPVEGADGWGRECEPEPEC